MLFHLWYLGKREKTQASVSKQGFFIVYEAYLKGSVVTALEKTYYFNLASANEKLVHLWLKLRPSLNILQDYKKNNTKSDTRSQLVTDFELNKLRDALDQKFFVHKIHIAYMNGIKSYLNHNSTESISYAC